MCRGSSEDGGGRGEGQLGGKEAMYLTHAQRWTETEATTDCRGERWGYTWVDMYVVVTVNVANRHSGTDERLEAQHLRLNLCGQVVV